MSLLRHRKFIELRAAFATLGTAASAFGRRAFDSAEMLLFTLRSFRSHGRSAASPPARTRALSSLLAVVLAFTPYRTAEAGDILRGGGVSGSSRAPGISGAGGGSPNEVGIPGRDTLARTTQALQAVKAMQAAARNAAVNGPNNLGLNPNQPGAQLPNVPNGLTIGGLQVAPRVPVNLSNSVAGEDSSLWQGAALPTQATAGNGRTQVTITQNRQQALLTWQTFNVGKETRVTFDQTAGGTSASQWIAFNKINDPSGIPSQILGSIDAVGQIYLINQNGIIFGGSSQVNLHTLVASSLPINDNLIARGLLNNPDNQFLFSALPLPAGGNGTPAFAPAASNLPDGRIGDVTVQPGAILQSPTTPERVGGRVALFGANVSNAGTISTPDGQAILAAGLQVGLAPHPVDDPSLRGLDVFVGGIADPASTLTTYAGSVLHSGLIDAPRASVTIAGKEISQLGFIDSSTSVSLNGRIDLLASYDAISNATSSGGQPNPLRLSFLFQSSGLITLGPDSVTRIVPELASEERVVGTQLALFSQVNLEAKTVHFAGDATLFAPSANVRINAGMWQFFQQGVGGTLDSRFVFSGGQIYLDSGALIDVSGSQGVDVPVSQNIVTAELRGTELADSPSQRDGPFRGQTIMVDIRQTGTYTGRQWIGTPLADVTGFINLIERSVGELTVAGGNVQLNAGNSVVLQPGAAIDVSGGWIDFQSGLVQTTQVRAGGRIFDISEATPDRVYDGIYTGFTVVHEKWGIVENFSGGLGTSERFEAGYVQGGSGGSLAISAAGMALDGELAGATIAGPRQRNTRPALSSLSLQFEAQNPNPPNFLPVSPTPPDIIFDSDFTVTPVGPFIVDAMGNPLPLPAARLTDVRISPALFGEDGFGRLTIENTDGDIVLPAGEALTMGLGGAVSFSAANIQIGGSISAPGGSLSFSAFNLSPPAIAALASMTGRATPPPNPDRGNFTLGATAVLSVAGLVVDDRMGIVGAGSLPFLTNGGSVSIAGFNVDVSRGFIDVSGGVAVSPTAAISYGAGGALSLAAGQDLTIPALLGGELTLGATLHGFSGGRGGSLGMTAPQIQIDGVPANPDVFFIAPEFFEQGGFSSFSLTGLGAPTAQTDVYLPGLVVAPDTVIEPVALSRLAFLNPPGTLEAPIADSVSFEITLQPEGLRSPVDLTFRAPGLIDVFPSPAIFILRGEAIFGEGSNIRTEPRGNITVTADAVTALGAMIAPGGRISITGATSFPFDSSARPDALPTVHFGPRSLFSVAGATVRTPDPRGFDTGSVLAGGTITISGAIVAEAGSILDVSGTSDVLDFPIGFRDLNDMGTTLFSGAEFVPIRVDSNAGTITLRGTEELFSDATLIGRAGGPSALGGNLSISSGRFYLLGESRRTSDINLVVTQNDLTIPPSARSIGVGRRIEDANGTAIQGLGYFVADRFQEGGFDSLTLGGNVQFTGGVSIDARRTLSIGSGGVITAETEVFLNASHIALGQRFPTPVLPGQEPFLFTQTNDQGITSELKFPPTFGPGILNAAAGLIEIGTLSLQNVGRANFIADHGDIRGSGTLDIAGDLNFTAGQVYTPTASQFNIVAYDYVSNGFTFPGIVTFAEAGVRQLPLSAGGELNIFSTIINQGGVLRAPLGTINLGRDGLSPTSFVDPIAGNTLPLPVALQLKLAPGSVTSVSAVDPTTGEELLIPYGLNSNGNSWIDPRGLDITAGGAPSKIINLAGTNLLTQTGSVVDISGGGDLYAYRFIPGAGGSGDILTSSSSFAVLPNYDANFAPFAPFNPLAPNLGSDPGYANTSLAAGDRIFLGASDTLPAGTYTLLPARYALLPGAVLVTPQSGVPTGTASQADGSSIVSGYRFNDLNSARVEQPLLARFEVASASVVRLRARYADFSANEFLRESAIDLDVAVPRLPIDAGRAIFTAAAAMRLQGAVTSQTPTGGRGGLIDISSPVDILIGGPGTAAVGGVLFLDASQLSAFNAQSLLIGGLRAVAGTGDPGGSRTGRVSDRPGSSIPATTINVTTNNLTVDNAGAALTGSDIILVANESLTLAPNAEIAASETASGSAELVSLGEEDIEGSGDGTLLRVSSGLAPIERFGVSTSNVPRLVIGAGARIAGNSVTLDSTFATSLDPNAVLTGNAVFLNSGQISLQFNEAGRLRPTEGLVLSGGTLQTLQTTASSLSVLSYSSLDLYGFGQLGGFDETGRPVIENLALHAAEIRGFNNDGGTVALVAQNISLDNISGRPALGSVRGASGSLLLYAETIRLGENQVNVDQFFDLTLVASGGIRVEETGGLAMVGNLNLNSPIITGAPAANYRIASTSALVLQNMGGAAAPSLTAGLGARLSLEGASVLANSDVVLPSGLLTLHATTGDLVVSGRLDVSGTAQTFFDLVKFTNAGKIDLVADLGNVALTAGSIVTVAGIADPGSSGAQPGLGSAGIADPGYNDAGSLLISAPNGSFTLDGAVSGQGGAGGTFTLDVGTLPTMASLNSVLDTAAMSLSRSIRVRNGDVLVDGSAQARTFNLAVDRGAITVTGTIDASGLTGGTINLLADGAIVLQSGSLLTAAAEDFSAASKGGAVSLETRGTGGAEIDLQTGSTIDLSVASNGATSAMFGRFTGTLHLRGPQTSDSSDLQLRPINGTIRDASSIVVEGYRVFDLTASGGLITSAVQNSVRSNGELFVGTAGTASPGYVAMRDRLLASNPGLEPSFIIQPGAEIINRTGNLTLGTTSSTATSDWNLASYRFGPRNAPGVLTLRAAGNLVFFNALSDGLSGGESLWLAPLVQQNPLLPINAQTWSYRLTAGADFSAADFRAVQPLDSLGANAGSLQLGKNLGAASVSGGAAAQTSTLIRNNFQVIRTGSGTIDISAGRDIQLLNQFATIYTAGTRVADPTTLFAAGDFVLPIITTRLPLSQGSLGSLQQAYFVQYSLAGGNVTLHAQENIERRTRDGSGNLIADSSRQLPNNWLYRRGYVDPSGQFGETGVGTAVTDPAASTTWWIDFSNFFEGVGALGGGNVTLIAGNDVANVDAVTPTNARMPRGFPDASKLIELGGGDLEISAGRNIDGGVYYVERGTGTLEAGSSITTNQTRSPSLGILRGLSTPEIFPSSTWLPTTLFVGKSTFEVSARGDVLLGPVANPFLLPQGLNNRYFNKTYFSTYGPESGVNVASLGGSLTLRQSATLPGSSTVQSILRLWMEKELLFTTGSTSAAFFQPWLRLTETSIGPFETVIGLMPPTLRATVFSDDLNIAGDLTLFPAARGTIELVSAGSINGLQPNGLGRVRGQDAVTWSASRVNLSDADPSAVPAITSPFAYFSLVGRDVSEASATRIGFLAPVDLLFDESGSSEGRFGVLQTKQALHAPGPLHAGDPNPARLYAQAGDISGLTFFSGKSSRVLAGADLADIALYLQNVAPSDVSLVAAGRDIVAYSANSPLRIEAQSPGNAVNDGEVPSAGDIQINGPGTLEVFAGRDLDLGGGPSNLDGTGVGIVSIGNDRNPFLPSTGAEIIAGAGIGFATGLASSELNIAGFVAEFLDPSSAGEEAGRYFAELGDLIGLANADDAAVFAAFGELPTERQAMLALEIFYLVLRDAGRDRNDPESSNFGNYDRGFAAIETLFPDDEWQGDISLLSRQIKTGRGGNVTIFVPGGELTVGLDTSGTQSVDQGILTEGGGNISIFTNTSVNVGTSRIFTLRGGNEIIWSSEGDIAAGSASKTVQSAPPTRVLIDPQSGDVQTDLAGLATGGGIGVLQTVSTAAASDIDLIAPAGTIDAGDAGIRVSGNLNIAALVVLNAGNISVGGASVGTPTVAAPNIGNLTAASNSTAAANDAAESVQQVSNQTTESLPSIITVEVLGYGGGDGDPDNTEDEEERRRRRQQQEQEPPPPEPLPQSSKPRAHPPAISAL